MSNIYFKDTKELIDPTIHKFLYALMKYIFYGKDQTKKETREKLYEFIKKINEKEKKESKHFRIYIDQDDRDRTRERMNCDLTNLEDILNFIRIHNFIMASEIIENIMIRLISFSFRAKSSDFFGKYIYNNLYLLRTNKKIILNWIFKEKLKYLFNNRTKDLTDILNYEEKTSNNETDNKKREFNIFINECTFIQFLLKIQSMRCMLNIPKYLYNKNTYGNTIISQSQISILSKTQISDATSNYYNQSCIFYFQEIGKTDRNAYLPLASSMLISSYIYYQNRHSPLMNYEPKNNLINLPFKYDLSEAGINDYNLGTIMSPIRIEPKIEIIELNKNNFGVDGLLGMYKVAIFNKHIKRISVISCGIKTKHLKYLLKNLRIFENKSIEELDV